MAIKSDNQGFLTGLPVDLKTGEEKVDRVLSNTEKILSIVQKGTRKVSASIQVVKPSVQNRNEEAKSVLFKKNKTEAKEVQRPSNRNASVNIKVITGGAANEKAAVVRNANGTFEGGARKDVTTVQRRVDYSGVVPKQQVKRDFYENRTWRINLFDMFKRGGRADKKAREKSDGLLQKILKKPFAGAKGEAKGGLGLLSLLTGGGIVGGGLSKVIGGASLLGGLGKGLLRNIGKLGGKRIPIIGSLLAAGMAYSDSAQADSDSALTPEQKGTQKAGIWGGLAGSLGGAWAGAQAGGMIGAAFGGVGAIPAAIVGGIIGAFGGESLGKDIGEFLYKKDWKQGWGGVQSGLTRRWDSLIETMGLQSSFSWDAMRSVWGKTWSEVQVLFPTMTANIENIFKDVSSNLTKTFSGVWSGVAQSIKDFMAGLRGEPPPVADPTSGMTDEQKSEYNREMHRFNPNNSDGTRTIERKLTTEERALYSKQSSDAGAAIAYKEIAFKMEKLTPWVAEKTYGKDKLAQMHKDYDGDVQRRAEADAILKKGTIQVKVKIGKNGQVEGEVQSDGSVKAPSAETSASYQAGAAVNSAGKWAGRVGRGFSGFGSDVDGYIKEAAERYGIDEKTLRGFVKMEGGWTGKMSPTGAIGTGQFVQGTWNDLAKSGEGKSIGMTHISRQNFRTSSDPRYNKRINTLATGLLAKKNADKLRRNGLPVTGENLYMLHNIGGGIIPALKGSNNVSAETMKAISQNGGNGMSPTEFVKFQKGRFNSHYNAANGVQSSGASAPPIAQSGGGHEKQKRIIAARSKRLNRGNIATPPQQIPAATVASTKNVKQDSLSASVPDTRVPVKLGSSKNGVSASPNTMVLAGQEIGDRNLAHVASGGIGGFRA